MTFKSPTVNCFRWVLNFYADPRHKSVTPAPTTAPTSGACQQRHAQLHHQLENGPWHLLINIWCRLPHPKKWTGCRIDFDTKKSQVCLIVVPEFCFWNKDTNHHLRQRVGQGGCPVFVFKWVFFGWEISSGNHSRSFITIEQVGCFFLPHNPPDECHMES